MPLAEYIHEELAFLRRFLQDPALVLLDLRVAPEQEQLVAKLIASLQDDEDEPVAVIAVSLGRAAAGGLCAAIEAAAVESIASLLPILAEERCRLDLPEGVDRGYTVPDLPQELRLAEYLERAARALSGFIDRIVVVTRVEEAPDDLDALRRSFAALAAGTGGGRVKYIVLDDDRAPALEGLVVAEARCVRAAPEPGAEHAVIEAFLARPAARLLLAAGDPDVGDRFHGALASPALRGTLRFLTLEVVDLPFVGAIHFYHEAEKQLAARYEQIERRYRATGSARALVDEVSRPIGHIAAEAAFARFLERLVGTCLAPDAVLVVRISPAGAEQRDVLLASLAELGRALVSPRTRVVVADPRIPLPADPPLPIVATRRFRLGAERIEDAFARTREDPDATPVARLRAESALAGASIAKGEPEKAVDHAVRALELAREMKVPAEIAVAWYGLGTTLYQITAFDDAAKAFAQCVDIGLDERHDALVAQGMLGMGHAHFLKGDYPMAVSCYETAQKLHRNLGNLAAVIYALTWKGEAHRKMRAHAEAERSFRAAIESGLGAPEHLADAVRSSIAEAYLRLGALLGEAGAEDQRADCIDRAASLGGGSAPLAEHP